MYSRGTHLTIADYWRWIVVHFSVEFFAVAIIALLLVTLGLVTAKSALRVAYLTAILIFLGGIPATAHHYFWWGGPSYGFEARTRNGRCRPQRSSPVPDRPCSSAVSC